MPWRCSRIDESYLHVQVNLRSCRLATDFLLLQFQLDRYIIQDVLVRCKVSEGRNADGHCFHDNQHWSPRQWRRHHRVLVDICEPLGEPDLFLTVSPWEWTFPFPFWITKAHRPLGKGPTAIPCPETLCNANALQQLCDIFLAKKSCEMEESCIWDKHRGQDSWCACLLWAI